MKIDINLSPEEFRSLLDPELRKTFDALVTGITEQGFDKPVAEAMVAKSFLEFLKGRASVK